MVVVNPGGWGTGLGLRNAKEAASSRPPAGDCSLFVCRNRLREGRVLGDQQLQFLVGAIGRLAKRIEGACVIYVKK